MRFYSETMKDLTIIVVFLKETIEEIWRIPGVILLQMQHRLVITNSLVIPETCNTLHSVATKSIEE